MYPQPNADNYETSGFGYFRLNTKLVSPGDIYESAQSAKAFAIGPDSDIANAIAVYFDPNVPPQVGLSGLLPSTQMNQVAFSSARAMVGQISARNTDQYSPANRPGRILLYCEDIYDPDYKPTGFNDEVDVIELVQPVFDVIQYFEPPQSLGPARVDRRYYFQDFNVSTGKQWVVLPYYGRRYAYLGFQNANVGGGGTVDVTVQGLNYGIVADKTTATPNRFHQETTIATPSLAPGAKASVVITADGSGPADGRGMYDAIVLSFDAQPCVTHIVFSDVNPGG